MPTRGKFKRIDYLSNVPELHEKGTEKEFEEFMKFPNTETPIEEIKPIRCPNCDEVIKGG